MVVHSDSPLFGLPPSPVFYKHLRFENVILLVFGHFLAELFACVLSHGNARELNGGVGILSRSGSILPAVAFSTVAVVNAWSNLLIYVLLDVILSLERLLQNKVVHLFDVGVPQVLCAPFQ